MAWENKVYNIYRRIFQKSTKIKPTNLNKICKDLNIKIIGYTDKSELNYISVDGFSKMKNNKFYIFVNKEKHIHRIRFTIAHELGHIFLNHFNDISTTLLANSGIDEQKEREANMFARLILAPPNITKNLKENEIAKTLHISEQMAKIVNKMKNKDYNKLNNII